MLLIKKIKIVKCCGARRLKFSALLLLILWIVWSCIETRGAGMPRPLRKYLRFPAGHVLPDIELTNSEVQQLKQKLGLLNVNIEVLNSDIFPPVSVNSTFIAVQVHRDAERLQHLIVSLAQVRYIDHVLLIFSHSYYDDSINALIKTIDFCKVIQVFYPYSLQLHPDHFPGVDVADGFNRDARRSEHKQHWWWKAHFIFDGLTGTVPPRDVIFLEEDDYVSPDLLFIYRHSRRLLGYFPSAEVIALGGPYTGRTDYDALLVGLWTPTYERGLTFNVTTWRKIISKASFYCQYNDCSWSYSLANVFGAFPSRSMDVVACMAPRVLASREVGDARAAAVLVRELAARARLFPRSLRAVVLVRPGRRHVLEPRAHAAGGWGDRRDQKLCIDLLDLNQTDPPSNNMPAPSIEDNVSKTWKFLLPGST